ncbi:MAG: metal-sulfur cluster assembly factor [bacterium]|nr:metal-sulfur cluster assembly factor [bacterium]
MSAEEQAKSDTDPTTTPPASTPSSGETKNPLTEEGVREQLKQVIDPELFVNIVDLGLIYVVDLKPNAESEKTDILVEMTMTSPMCPAGPQLVANSRAAVEAMEGVGEVEIKVVMDPPWTQDMMTEDARDQLNIF